MAGASARSPTKVAPSPSPPGPRRATGPWRFEAAERVVALGDVHGDLAATRAALRLAGLIGDGDDTWTGGRTVLVQTGDMLDRGDDEQAIVDLLLALQRQAANVGGRVHLLQGNHELMNVAGDFRYVTPGGFADFDGVPLAPQDRARAKGYAGTARARAAAFLPGGPYARKLAPHPVAIVVGRSVFAHGGVLPKHVRYGLARMNAEVTAWLLGEGRVGLQVVQTPDSPVWSRHFSDRPDPEDCQRLQRALVALDADRMVVGHTVQPTITAACGERVWRVDVGMARHYGGQPEVLEITAAGVRPIRAAAPAAPPSSAVPRGRADGRP
ncbi:MAG: metallophosphoesterase [Myxococcota bacterium]